MRTVTGDPETSVKPTLVWNFASFEKPFAVARPCPRESPVRLRNPGTNCPKVPLALCVYARLVAMARQQQL